MDKTITRKEIFQYVKKKYGTEPEYLWADTPFYAVLRHKDNKKWYAIIMNISGKSLKLEEDNMVDIINVKSDPDLIGSLLQKKGYFAAYHMNKTHWITILLDGSVASQEIYDLIDLSYHLTDKHAR